MTGQRGRVAEAFQTLAVIKRTVDDAPVPADVEAIEAAAATDRELADHYRGLATGGGVGLYTLCCRLVDERSALAREIESIRRLVGALTFKPEARKRNQGPGARRGDDTKGGSS